MRAARAVLLFTRDVATAFAIPAGLGLVLTLALGYSSPNRSEASLRAVPFASFLPTGATLSYDHFIRGTAALPFAIDHYDRAVIEREMYTDDPAAFQQEFIDLAHRVRAKLVYGKTIGDAPLLTALRTWDTHSGFHLGAYIADSTTTFTFSHRTAEWRVLLTIRDGPCMLSGSQTCVPAE